jgi:predicted NBD/HSP70 family sugar kinase
MTIRGVVVDLSGAPLTRRSASFDPPLTADALVDAVRDLTLSLTDGLAPGRVFGVGAGASGVVDPDAGVVRLSGALFTRPGVFATDYPLRAQLERALPWPVQLANDANLGALATFREQVRDGTLSAGGSLLYVIAVESLWGFGAGVIIGGRLYLGAHGAAGELLHPRLLSAPPDWGDLPRRALGGDPDARGEVIEALRPMFEHLVALTLTIDTDCLVLGGAFAALGRPLQQTLAEMMVATPGFGAHLVDLPERGIILDPRWPDTVALGAGELVLEGVFREPSAREPGPLVRLALEGTG